MSATRRFDRRDLALAIGVGVVGAAVLLHRVALGEAPFADDLVDHHYPHRALFLADGGPPEWNPYLFTGLPFLADIQNAAFHPLTIAYRFLAPWWATVVVLAIDFVVAAIGASWMASRHVETRAGRALAGAIYAFSGYLVVHHLHLGMHVAAAMLPWCVGATERAIEPETRAIGARAIAIAALAFAGTLTAGHMQLPLYCAFAVAIVALSSRGALARRIAVGAAIGLLGAWIAAAALVPLALWLPHTARPGQATLAFACSWALGPDAWPMAIAPDLFGRGSEGAGGGHYLGPYNYWEMTSYLGVLPLVVFVGSLVAALRDRAVRSIAIVGAFGAVVAIGPWGLVHVALFYALPGYGMFRNSNRAWILAVVAASTIVPWALEQIFARTSAWSTRARRLKTSAFAIAAIVLVASVAMAIGWHGWLARDRAWAAARAIGLLVATGVVLAGSADRLLSRAAAIVAIDLALQWATYVPMAAPETIRAASDVVAGLARVDPHARLLESGWTDDPQRESLTASTNGVVAARVRSLRGYNPLLSGAYARAWAEREPQPPGSEPHWPRLPNVFTPFFASLGQRWWLAPTGVAAPIGWVAIRADAHRTLWQRDAVLARVFAVAPPPSELIDAKIEDLDRLGDARLEWLEDAADAVAVRATLATRATVVLGDAWAPGWTVAIDDAPAIASPKVAEAFRGVSVDAGVHVVRWSYRTPGLRAAIALSWIGLAVALALLAAPRVRPARG